MPREREWKTDPKTSIQVRGRWKYGFHYIEADMETFGPVNVNWEDAITFRGRSPEGDSVYITIGCKAIKSLLPQIHTVLEKRDAEVERREAMPICEVCGLHKEDAESFTYQNLKMCDDCHRTTSLQRLEQIVEQKKEKVGRFAEQSVAAGEEFGG